MSVQISSKLPDKLSVFFVVSFRLQGLVLDQKLTGFFACLVFHLDKLLLKLMSLSIELHFKNIKLALTLVVLFS